MGNLFRNGGHSNGVSYSGGGSINIFTREIDISNFSLSTWSSAGAALRQISGKSHGALDDKNNGGKGNWNVMVKSGEIYTCLSKGY